MGGGSPFGGEQRKVTCDPTLASVSAGETRNSSLSTAGRRGQMSGHGNTICVYCLYLLCVAQAPRDCRLKWLAREDREENPLLGTVGVVVRSDPISMGI